MPKKKPARKRSHKNILRAEEDLLQPKVQTCEQPPAVCCGPLDNMPDDDEDDEDEGDVMGDGD